MKTSKGVDWLIQDCVAELVLGSFSGFKSRDCPLWTEEESPPLCQFKRVPEACVTSQQPVSLSLICKWIKMSALLQMQWKCYFGENKRQLKQMVWTFSTSTLQPSLKLLVQLPHNFANELSGKSLAGHEHASSSYKRNEGRS